MMAMNKKNLKQKVILALIFGVGLSVFLFPLITNFINAQEHNKVISYYQGEVDKLESIDKLRLQKEASEYNQRLMGGAMIRDPFAKTSEEKEEGISYLDMLSIGEVMAYLEIPKIDIYLPIYHGTSDEVLTQGLGHIEQTSLPVGGKGTNSVLTGHRGLPTSTMFRYLDKLDIGDEFFVHSLDEVLAYQIFESVIVKPNDIERLRIDKDEDIVTLITCDPYMINTNRLLVRGRRIDYVAPIEFVNEETNRLPMTEKVVMDNLPEESNNGRLMVSATAGITLISVLCLILFKRGKNKQVNRHET